MRNIFFPRWLLYPLTQRSLCRRKHEEHFGATLDCNNTIINQWKAALVFFLIHSFCSACWCPSIYCCCLSKCIWLNTPFINREKVTPHVTVLNFIFSAHWWVGLCALDESEHVSITPHRWTDIRYDICTRVSVFFHILIFRTKSNGGWRDKNKKKNIQNDLIYNISSIRLMWCVNFRTKITKNEPILFENQNDDRQKYYTHEFWPAVRWKIIPIYAYAHISAGVRRFDFISFQLRYSVELPPFIFIICRAWPNEQLNTWKTSWTALIFVHVLRHNNFNKGDYELMTRVDAKFTWAWSK